MYKLIMLLLLVSCGVGDREVAIKFAKDFCSCNRGLESIHFTGVNFSFRCRDNASYGTELVYDSIYYGDVCEKK